MDVTGDRVHSDVVIKKYSNPDAKPNVPNKDGLSYNQLNPKHTRHF